MYDESRLVNDDNGLPLEFIGSWVDITERKRSERVLSLEKRILEMITSRDALGKVFETVNKGVEELLEGTLSSILLLDADLKCLRRGSAPSLPDDYNQAIDGITIGPSAGSCGTAAYRNERVIVPDITKDPLWADYCELGVAHGLRACWSTPIRSSAGKVLGTFALYYGEPRSPTDPELGLIDRLSSLIGIVIEKNTAEKALAASELRYRTLYDDNPSMYFTVAPDGTVLSVNVFGAQELGYKVDELIGESVLKIFAEEEKEAAQTQLETCLSYPKKLPVIRMDMIDPEIWVVVV